MAVFNTNQVRNFYVVNAVNDALSNLGDVKVGGKTGESFYFSVVGKGGVTRSDEIVVANGFSGKATKASAMETKPKIATITTTSVPAAGTDCIIRLTFPRFMSLSDSDQYFIYGEAPSTGNATTTYAALAASINANAGKTGLVVATSSASGLVITALPQDWIRGKKAQDTVDFSVSFVTDFGASVAYSWGTAIGNGKKIADLEYFCMGERGDIYRGVGYPHNLETEYMVESGSEYHVLDIHYNYQGSAEDVQKSEKDITIVAKKGASGHEYDVINAVIKAVNIASGASTWTTGDNPKETIVKPEIHIAALS